MTCERCGKKFNVDEEREKFERKTIQKYDFFEKDLCSTCAIEAINNMEKGIYHEYCEMCGEEFDPIEVEEEFERRYNNEAGSYRSLADITELLLCLDCAIEEYNNK